MGAGRLMEIRKEGFIFGSEFEGMIHHGRRGHNDRGFEAAGYQLRI